MHLTLTFIGLERCAGEVVTDMLTIIENCEPDEAQMRLVMRGTCASLLSPPCCHSHAKAVDRIELFIVCCVLRSNIDRFDSLGKDL
jgi:hypothetical protein